ncbi:Intramolecular chaperone auto-processing domain containing protein [uncultured Caudovirales phage]|uniref:Intramolecular chaperone auto-processing domain containing protein n=1 Tax=uncultured Caudovirales phage TaxID=2100421 RepID=A0A6J7WM77_9CAUD|nr:Intramolecular chaperone auto-processing domain containing protein [uncultured Caudovirales phage]
MGGGGFLGLGPAPSAPAAPDYTGAAQQTAQGNLDAARAATAANRVNQVTPYGNLDYTQSGTDPYGNPTWTATTSLSDVGQQLLNNQNQTSLGLGGTINAALGQVQNTMGQAFNPNLPSTGLNPGQSYQDAYMQRLAPQLEQSRESNIAQLANQGIAPGTKAYENAMRQQAMKENDLLLGATTQGFGTGLQANQQAYNQAMTNYNMPLNTLSALRSGSQVQNPTFVNSAQQATTGGADILGATQMGYNAQMGNFNAQQAAQQGLNSGLMGLGGTLGAAAIMSDIRTKEHIKAIGWLPNGLPVYEYEYKPEWKDEAGHGKFIGIMAQEVEMVKPEAVFTRPDGYKMVNYGVLNG